MRRAEWKGVVRACVRSSARAFVSLSVRVRVCLEGALESGFRLITLGSLLQLPFYMLPRRGATRAGLEAEHGNADITLGVPDTQN